MVGWTQGKKKDEGRRKEISWKKKRKLKRGGRK